MGDGSRQAEMQEGSLETIVLETMSTLDYRAERWKIEKIADEMFQNHLTTDSGGTKAGVFLRIDGRWVNLKDLDADKEYSPDTICFFDNGSGFDYIHTALYHSSKKERETQTGKFGEGIKMYSAAALRNNVVIQIRSRNWMAEPVARRLYLAAEGKEVSLLCQKITVGLEKIKGSQSFIHDPHPGIVKRVLSFRERVFMYRDDLHGRRVGGEFKGHQIFLPLKDGCPGELFVKEFKYETSQPLFLTYKINGEDADSLLTPDRDSLKENSLRRVLGRIVRYLDRKELITPLLDDKTPKYFEKDLFYYQKVKHPDLWREAFHDLYGENAVLAGVHKNINSNVEQEGFRVVKLPDGLSGLLHNAGIKKADEILNYRPKYEIVLYEELTDDEKYVVDCFSRADALMLNGRARPAEIRIFSRAYDENGEVTWFKGMTSLNVDPPVIYIRRSELNSLTTYAHERAHVETGSVDMTEGFEKGLTEQLGFVLDRFFGLRSWPEQ